MITLENIKAWSKPHPIGDGGKVTRICNEKYTISIVGGRSGLYGDFVNTFEVAIMDKKKGDFITKLFFSELGDEVISYMEGKDVVEIVNRILHKGFQVL